MLHRVVVVVVVVVVRYCVVVMGVQGIIRREIKALVIVAVRCIICTNHVPMVTVMIVVIVTVRGGSIVVTAVLIRSIVGM